MEDEYQDDAQFYDEDAEFYGGLEDDPGRPYPTIYEDSGLGGLGAGYLVARPKPAAEPEPERWAGLVTPEEFMRKYGLTG